MSFTRREFLQGMAAGIAAGTVLTPLARADAGRRLSLRAGVFRQQIVAGSGPATEVWGFNSSLPGPLLRFRKGERVRVDVSNELPQGTTVHWHGLRVPNAMDGVPHVTQKPIATGGSHSYEFDVADSGTFWYHPHQASFEQVGRGLFGPLIVEEEKPIEVDLEWLWVLADLKLWPDNQQVDDFGNVKDVASFGRIGNVVTLNGRSVSPPKLFEVRAGERIRLRLLNCATARVMGPVINGHRPRVIALDGQAVEPHEPDNGVLLMGPGMRVDIVLDCTGKPGETYSVVDAHDRNSELARLVYVDAAPLRSAPSRAPIALAPNALPEPDLAKAERHMILFQGGMSGPPAIGMVDGKPLGIKQMLEKEGLAWTLNLTAAHEHALLHVPFLFLKRGQSIILSMVNQTGFEHPMHLHGHTFRVVARNGKAPPRTEWRDTVLMGPRETVDVAFVADNPGDWMFHCHILEHAAGGMMGTIRVS